MSVQCETPGSNKDQLLAPRPSAEATFERNHDLDAQVRHPSLPGRSPVAEGTLPGRARATTHQRMPPKHAKPRRRWSWDVLVYRDFRRYFAGSVASNFGTWIQNTAQALLAYKLTHSVLAVGAVACAQFIWVLILGPWAGAIISGIQNVKGLLIGTQVASACVAATLAFFAFFHDLNEMGLIAGALFLGLAYCLALPATSVLVPALIPQQKAPQDGEEEAVARENQHRIRDAMALDHTSYNIGRATAPIAAVLMIATIGFTLAFVLNALSFLVLAFALSKTRPSFSPRAASSAELIDNLRGVKGEFLENLREIKADARLWLLLGIVATVTISADPVLVLGPVLARHFGITEAWAGYFLAALGAGTLLGSLIPMGPPTRVRHAAWPLAFLGAAGVVFAIGVNFEFSLVAALVAGIACLLTGSAARALLFTLAPGEGSNRATVMGIWAVAWAGSKPLASLIDGALATYLGIWAARAHPGTWVAALPGARTAGILMAVPALIPALLVWRRMVSDRWVPMLSDWSGRCWQRVRLRLQQPARWASAKRPIRYKIRMSDQEVHGERKSCSQPPSLLRGLLWPNAMVARPHSTATSTTIHVSDRGGTA